VLEVECLKGYGTIKRLGTTALVNQLYNEFDLVFTNQQHNSKSLLIKWVNLLDRQINSKGECIAYSIGVCACIELLSLSWLDSICFPSKCILIFTYIVLGVVN
jgi:hypothetical protein